MAVKAAGSIPAQFDTGEKTSQRKTRRFISSDEGNRPSIITSENSWSSTDTSSDHGAVMGLHLMHSVSHSAAVLKSVYQQHHECVGLVQKN